MDLNDTRRHGDEEIPDLYINRDKYFNDLDAYEYDDDPVYTRMEKEGKISNINTYNLANLLNLYVFFQFCIPMLGKKKYF